MGVAWGVGGGACCCQGGLLLLPPMREGGCGGLWEEEDGVRVDGGRRGGGGMLGGYPGGNPGGGGPPLKSGAGGNGGGMVGGGICGYAPTDMSGRMSGGICDPPPPPGAGGGGKPPTGRGHKSQKPRSLSTLYIMYTRKGAHHLGFAAVLQTRATCSRRATPRRRGTGTLGYPAVCSSSSARTRARSEPQSWPVCLLCSLAPHLQWPEDEFNHC